MKNYKKIIVGSLMTAIIVASPLASFADNDKGNNRDNDRKEEKEKNRDYKSNWFSNWFGSNGPKNTLGTPVISDLNIISNKTTKATIKWNTDIRSNSMVWYSTTSGVDTTKAPNMKRNDRVSKHKFEIKKLQANTTYYVVVGNATNGGIVKSNEISFTTGTSNTNISIPVITSVSGPATVKTEEVATFILNANDPQGKTLTYSVDWGDQKTTDQSSFTNPTTITHIYSKVGTYIAKFTVTNTDGKKVTYPMKVVVTATQSPDVTAPVLSEIQTTVNGKNVTVSWKTNEPSNGTIFYNTVTPVDTNATTTQKVENTNLVTKHSLSIPNLTSNTLYHFIIKSIDASNNATSSSEVTFSTN